MVSSVTKLYDSLRLEIVLGKHTLLLLAATAVPGFGRAWCAA